MAVVLHFEILDRRHRLVLAPDRARLERFDGTDALDVERWKDANMTGTDGRVDECIFDAAIEAAARAALAHPTKGRVLSSDAKALLARAQIEALDGNGPRGLIQCNPFEVFELAGVADEDQLAALLKSGKAGE